MYNNAVLSVAALDLSAVDDTTADAYRQIYRDTVTGSPIASGSGFDLYHNESKKTLTYVNESCEPEDVANRFVLSLAPVDANNLPVYVKQQGRNRRTVYFDFGENGVKFDGKCLMVFQLPEYPTYQISVGHQIGGQNHFWGNLTEVERIVEDAGDPVIRSDWDIYLVGDSLIYVSDQCSSEDVEPEFFLHVDPVDMNDLPSHRKQHGFNGFNFFFRDHLLIEGEVCVARRELRDFAYAIAAVRTGQFNGDGQIWNGGFDLAGPPGDGQAAP